MTISLNQYACNTRIGKVNQIKIRKILKNFGVNQQNPMSRFGVINLKKENQKSVKSQDLINGTNMKKTWKKYGVKENEM